MKLVTLSEQILKFVVSSYKESLNDYIDFDLIKEYFSEHNENYLVKATSLLEQDGFVSTFEADNTILHIILLPESIRNVEENTFIKKGYTILKEIRNLLP